MEDGGIVNNANKVNYEEQLRRVLRDTPSPEPLSDDEDFVTPPESPPLEETPKTKTPPGLTATEYFASRSPLTPLPVIRKRSSSLEKTKQEPE